MALSSSMSAVAWMLLCLVISVTILPVLAMTPHQTCEPPDPGMNATQETIEGEVVIWQIPANPRAVLFLAHGAEQNSFMFFDRGPGCPQCYGLPESRDAVLDALSEGYAVLTLNCRRRMWKDWPLQFAVDLVKTWAKQHSLDNLPLVGWGHSAGGFMMSYLASRLPFQALVLMCSQGDQPSLEQAVPENFPPTLFVYMNNTREDSLVNLTNVDDVALAKAILTGRGVPICERRMFPKPVSASLFAESIHCIDYSNAEKIYGALRADGSWLDEDGYLRRDPWVYDWRSLMLDQNAMSYCEEFGDLCLAEHVEAELRLAGGVHSFTSDANPEIFSWLNFLVSSSAALTPRFRSENLLCQSMSGSGELLSKA